MARPASRVTISEFDGLISNRGAFASRPGQMSVCTNLRCSRPGELSVRKGHVAVATGGDDPAGIVLAAASFELPGGTTLLWQVAGSIYEGESPTV